MNQNIYNYIQYLRTNISLALAAILFVASIAISVPTKAAASINTVRDCDSNAVVYCGATTVNELQKKYNSNASTRSIYSYFGISKQDVQNMDKTAKVGRVTKSGDVYLDGKVVARDSVTAGRLFIAGSTKVSHNGVTFYKRAPRVSFMSNSLDAFVVMRDGQFDFAILAACGNPVKARAVPKPKPTPTPTPTPTPVPTPTPTPTPTPVPTPTPEVPTVLPNTGPTDIIAVFLGSSSIGSLAYYFFVRRKF